MRIVRGLLDRLLLIGSVIAGGLVPGFIAQYRQRLGGRLDQAQLDLAPWQKLADQFHQGDLEQLIRYHLASSDPTFRAEGHVIQSLLDTVHALQASLFKQMVYLIGHAEPGLLHATYADWVPTFALSGEGLLFAALFALAVWFTFQALWWLLALSAHRIAGQRYA